MEKEKTKGREKTNIIAVAGKGGVGKTSIAALMVKALVKEKPKAKILAIDADPAVGLSTALGITVHKTIDDIRKEFIDKAEGGKSKEAIEVLNEANYELINTIVEADGFCFIAVGRPETAGCYCKVNDYLKQVIALLADNFDYIVIDGEAGIEQINRRVMEKVTHLLLVSDTSKKGTQVIQSIKEVADRLVMYDKAGALINRVKRRSVGASVGEDGAEHDAMDPETYIDVGEMKILSFIGEDENIGQLDMEGKSLLHIQEGSEGYQGVYRGLKAMGIL